MACIAYVKRHMRTADTCRSRTLSLYSARTCPTSREVAYSGLSYEVDVLRSMSARSRALLPLLLARSMRRRGVPSSSCSSTVSLSLSKAPDATRTKVSRGNSCILVSSLMSSKLRIIHSTQILVSNTIPCRHARMAFSIDGKELWR